MEAVVVVICLGLLASLLFLRLTPSQDAASPPEGIPEPEDAFSDLSGFDESQAALSAQASRSREFDLYADAVTESGRFDQSHHGFSSGRFPHKPPSMVTGLTFQEDRLFVLRGQGVTVFPFAPSVTLAVVQGRTEGFRESTPFSMTLSSEVQGVSVRFPLEFPGWLEVVHRARRAGVVVEMDEALPERLKEFIAEPLYGESDLPPVVIRHEERRNTAPRPAKCPACGAGVGRKDVCDYCGQHLP